MFAHSRRSMFSTQRNTNWFFFCFFFPFSLVTYPLIFHHFSAHMHSTGKKPLTGAQIEINFQFNEFMEFLGSTKIKYTKWLISYVYCLSAHILRNMWKLTFYFVLVLIVFLGFRLLQKYGRRWAGYLNFFNPKFEMLVVQHWIDWIDRIK